MSHTHRLHTLGVLRYGLIVSVLWVTACSDQTDESADTASSSAEETTVQAPSPDTTASSDIPISTDSDTARALYLEGQRLLDFGRNIEARARFNAAIEADPEFALGHYGRSNAALSFNEFQRAMDAATSHLDGLSEGERLMIAINQTFLTNNATKGLELADQLVNAYPNSARAFIIRASARGGQNDNERARDDLEMALTLEPGSPAALAGLASSNLFGEPRDFEAAITWAQGYVQAYPDEAKTYEMLGDVLRGAGDLEAAADAYTRAESVDPTLYLAAHKNGHVNSFLGQIDEARQAYDRAIALASPENKSGSATYKAFTRIHEGNIEAAIAELEEVAENVEALGTPADQVKGNRVAALSNAATAAMHAGMLDKAAELVERRNALVMAIAEDVGTEDARRLQQANTHQFSGLLAAYQGNTEEAGRHAAAYMALVAEDDNPRKNEPAHFVLGMDALIAKEYEVAVDHLSQADHANNMYVRYHLALAEAAVGEAESAARRFAEVASYNFNSVGFALVGRDAKERASG